MRETNMNKTVAILTGAPAAPQHLHVPLHLEPEQPRVRRAACVAGAAAALGLTLAWGSPAPTGPASPALRATALAEEAADAATESVGIENAPGRDWIPDAPDADAGGTSGGNADGDDTGPDAAPQIDDASGGAGTGTTQDYIEPPSDATDGGYAYQAEVLSAGGGSDGSVGEGEQPQTAVVMATPTISSYDPATGILTGTADAGVTVRALLADGSVAAEAVAGEDGTFSLQLPAGTDLSGITVVAVGADGAASAAASGADFVAAQAAAQQKQARAQVSAQVDQAVASLARDMQGSLAGSGLFADYDAVSTQMPLSGYAFGLAAGVAASAVAIGGYLGVRRYLASSAEGVDQDDARDVAPAAGLPGLADEDDLELLAMALYGPAEQDGASGAVAPAAHAAPAAGGAAAVHAEGDAFAGAGHAEPVVAEEPGVPVAEMDTAQMIALLGDAGVSAAAQAPADIRPANRDDAEHDGMFPGMADLSGLDVFDGALVKGDVSRVGEESDEDWRAVAADEGPLDVSSFTPAAHDAHEPTAPTRPSPTVSMGAARPRGSTYVAPVIGPSTPPRVLPVLQREVEAVPEVDMPAPRPDLSAALTLAAFAPGPVQSGRVPAAARMDLDEPQQKSARRGRGIWGGRSQRARASETVGVPQIQRGAAFAQAQGAEASRVLDAQVSCVVPEIPDVPEVNPMSTMNLGGSSFMSGLTSVVNATGYVQQAVATTLQPDVASAMSRAEHGDYCVPMVNEDGQLPDTDVVTYDPSIYQTSASSPAYIDYLVRDEFTHRHDSPARRAAATGQFHVIDGTASLYTPSASGAGQTYVPLH